MKKIKLFLASSSELKEDREQFEIFIYRKCKSWFDQGIFLHLDIWEDFLDAMSSSGLQNEYNKVIKLTFHGISESPFSPRFFPKADSQ